MLALEGGLKTFLGSGSAQPAPLQPVAGRVESRVKGLLPSRDQGAQPCLRPMVGKAGCMLRLR